MNNFFSQLMTSYLEIPEQVAITLLYENKTEKRIRYRDLFLASSGYAKQLDEAGIQPGEVSIIILPHSETLIYAFWGAILHGGIPSIMPFLTEKLSPDHYRKSLESLFKITAPAAVITDGNFVAEVNKARINAPSVRAVLIAEEISHIESIEQTYLHGQHSSLDEIVLLQHSSGTTGLQKGVALSQQAVLNQLNNYSSAIYLNSSNFGKDTIVSWLPLYHDMGLIAGFILPILTQTPLILLSPFDWVKAPYKLLHAISNYKGTLSWLPNFAYNFCAQKIRSRDIEGIDLSSWRSVINCSEPMYWQSHQMFLDRFAPFGLRSEALATCYAMAENVFAVTQGGIDKPISVDIIDQNALLMRQIALPVKNDNNAIKMLSAGQPIKNTKVGIIDQHGHPLPDRMIGEIILYSDCMLTGYYKRSDLTDKAFINGWYLTGDLGYIAEDEVYITGRKKDLIIVGGKNIYPQDLERLASEIPGVHPGRVAAFGVFNDIIGTEDVVIVCEVDISDERKKQKIENDIKYQVTTGSDIALRNVFLVPRGWLLKTSSGKVSRSANREKYLAQIFNEQKP